MESSDAFGGEFSACKVCKKDLGAVSQFLRLTTKLFAVEFRCIFVLSASKVYKNVLGAFSRFLHAKTKLLAVKSRRILEVFTLKLHKKSSGRIFKIFASRNEGISREVQTHFGSFLPASFTEEVLGAISRFVCPKMKLFAVKFRRIFEDLSLARFMKNVDAFSRFFRPKAKLFAVEFRCILEVFSMQAL